MNDVAAHRVSWRLDDQEWPVRVARCNAVSAVSAWDVPAQWIDAVALLVSELVTNALGYGEPPVTLTLTLLAHENGQAGAGRTRRTGRSAHRLLIEVTDGRPDPPVRKPPGEDGGFGLGIIESLSELTIVRNGRGKTMRALYDPVT